MHTAAGEEIRRQLRHGIGLVGGEGELVIGLLVASGIAGSARLDILRSEDQIVHAKIVQPIRRRPARGAGADDNGVRTHRWDQNPARVDFKMLHGTYLLKLP